MLNRRDFIRVSSGVAAGAVLAGLGISMFPTNARAEVAITGATLGLVVAGILAAYGIGTTNFNVGVELGVPEALGNAFMTFSRDAQNYNKAVTAANSRISQIPGGVGFTDSELYDSIASASYLDGLSTALDSSKGLSLDWLNARGVQQAGFWGMINAFTSSMLPKTETFVNADIGSCRLINGNASFSDLANFWGMSPSSSGYSKYTAALETLNSLLTFPVASSLAYSFPKFYSNGTLQHYATWAFYFDKVPSFTWHNNDFGGSLVCSGFSQCARIAVNYEPSSNNVSWSTAVSINPPSIDIGDSVRKCLFFGSYGWDLSTLIPLTPGVPGVGSMADVAADVGDMGFGGAIIGDGFTADNGKVTGFGTLPVFNPAYKEGTFPGVIDYPYPTALLDWRTGVFTPGDVLSRGVPVTDIPGVAAPVPNGIALPTDVPVTVGIPISDGISVPSTKTLTLDNIIADRLETSITGSIAPSVPVEGTPFYPVNPPGSNSKPPSTLPDFPFPSIFPFNMLFEWLKWIQDNI